MLVRCSKSVWHRNIPRQATPSVPRYDGESVRPFAVRSGEVIGLLDGRYFGSGEGPPNHVVDHSMPLMSSRSFDARESMMAVGFYYGTTFVTPGVKTRHMSVSDLFIQSYSTINLLQNTFYRMKISFF